MAIGSILKVGLAAGAIAAVVLGLFFVLVMGPLIDEAESYEEESNPVGVVERRLVGFAAFFGVGLLIAIGYALVFPLVTLVFPGPSLLPKALAYGGLAFLIFTFLPLLAVPVTPPAVEMVPSVEEREFWYAATLASSLGGVVAAFGLYFLVSPLLKTGSARRALIGAGVAVVAFLWALPFLLMPEIRPLPGPVPDSLVASFYLLTFVEWLLFWLVLSVAVGFLWPRFTLEAPEATRVPV